MRAEHYEGSMNLAGMWLVRIGSRYISVGQKWIQMSISTHHFDIGKVTLDI